MSSSADRGGGEAMIQREVIPPLWRGIAWSGPARHRYRKRRCRPHNIDREEKEEEDMMFRRTFIQGALGLTAGMVGASRPLFAKLDYPTNPIDIIVPFDAGSTTDILARLVAQYLSKSLGTTVVENRPGAGGTIAAGFVARAEPSGYTLLMGTLATQAISQSIMPNISYDSTKDFTDIAMVADAPNIIVVNKDLPVTTLPDLVALAKKTPGGLQYASAGSGTSSHLSTELLAQKTGVMLVQIPYKNAGQAILDLSYGRVPMMIYQVPALLPHLKAGTIRAIAVTSKERLPQLPDVPTAEEQGITGYEASAWFGIFGPSRMPPEIVDRLANVINTAISSPEVGQFMKREVLIPRAMAQAAFSGFVKDEIVRWAAVVHSSGAKIE
jgi:tripartite-type tricarboxylate transporter receptor subunit TctC